MAPLRNRSTRTANEVDVLEGLPVRQWRLAEALIGPPPADTIQSAIPKSRWPELPMPRDAHLLPEHSQQLLRLARAGALPKRPAEVDDEDEKPGGAEPEEKAEEASSGFTAKKWTQVPRHLEEPEVEYLAKRRKGLPPLHAVGAIATAGPMRKTKVRKLDSNGVAHVYEVLAPEGQKLEGEIEEAAEAQAVEVETAAAPGTVVEGIGIVNAEGVVVSNDLLQPTPNRRKPPPPRKKKKSGPGRGHKKVLFKAEDGTTVDSQTPTRTALDLTGATEGDSTPKQTSTTGDGDTPMPDAQDDDEDEGSEEGEEGDDDDREEGELPQSPEPEAPGAPQITPAVPALPTPSETEVPSSTVPLDDIPTTSEALETAPIQQLPEVSLSVTSSDLPSGQMSIPALSSSAELAMEPPASILAPSEPIEPVIPDTAPPMSTLPEAVPDVSNVEQGVAMADVDVAIEPTMLPTVLEDTVPVETLPGISETPGVVIDEQPPIVPDLSVPEETAVTAVETHIMDPIAASAVQLPGLDLPAAPIPADPVAPLAQAEPVTAHVDKPDIFGSLELELDRSSQNPSTQPTNDVALPPPAPPAEQPNTEETSGEQQNDGT